jgi:hypothetical protein
MAGKTFPGIGELEDESTPLDSADAADSGDSRPFYSGPTVVDDVKVEEGLKKLRSLDIPLGPLTGITKAVVDALESGPTRVTPPAPFEPAPARVKVDPVRETAVGRNVVGPAAGREVIPPLDDRALRGTLFGHGVHLPEFSLPAPEEPPASGALAVVNRGAKTTTVAVYQPDAGRPREAEPFARSSQVRNTPLTSMDVSEEDSRKNLITRVVIGAAGIAAIVAAALIWTHASDDSGDGTRASVPAVSAPTSPPPPSRPALAPPPPPAALPPPAAAAPVQVAREPIPDLLPAAPTPPPAASSPAVGPVARHGVDSRDPRDEADGSTRPHRHTDRHREPTSTSTSGRPGSEASPAKPATRPGKRSAEEDPDAPMAPTIE